MADLFKQTFGAQGAVDFSQPPEGIPLSFWQHEIIDNPANAAGLKWLADPTAKGGFDRFPTKESYLKFLQQASADIYRRVPEAKKREYEEADKTGGVDPNSVEGSFQRREAAIDEERNWAGANFEGVDALMPELEATSRAAAAGEIGALEKLNELLAGIKDPTIADYVGDYVSQAASAAADPRDIEAQQRQLAKLEGLSDPTITAEERLMMEMARRQTEGDLRAQRGAIKNDLQARGVYGSGFELTMNLAAQQEAASRQALEMLGAQANAQKRAMDALYGAKDLSTSMRQSSAQESQFRGTAADHAAEFNKTLKDNYDQWKANEERKNNEDRIRRGEAIAGNVGKIGNIGVGTVSNIMGARGKVADNKYQIHKDAVTAEEQLEKDKTNYWDTDHTKDEVKL